MKLSNFHDFIKENLEEQDNKKLLELTITIEVNSKETTEELIQKLSVGELKITQLGFNDPNVVCIESGGEMAQIYSVDSTEDDNKSPDMNTGLEGDMNTGLS